MSFWQKIGFKKIGKEISRPFKKVFKEGANRVVGDIKGYAFKEVMTKTPFGPATKKFLDITTPSNSNSKIVPDTVPEGDMNSWLWLKKYLEVQRQVAEANAIKAPALPGREEELTIEKIALPAAGIGLLWWFLG